MRSLATRGPDLPAIMPAFCVGPALANLTVWDRETICNMTQELGATSGLFPSDEQTRRFLRSQDRESDWRPLAADPDDASKLLFVLGRTYMSAGRRTESVETFQIGLRSSWIQPDNSDDRDKPLAPEGTLATWERLRKQEEELYQKTPERTSIDLVRDLLRWEAELLERQNHREAAQTLIARTIDLLDGSREQLSEMIAWLMA